MKLFRTIEAVADGNYNVGDVIAFTLNDGEDHSSHVLWQSPSKFLFL